MILALFLLIAFLFPDVILSHFRGAPYLFFAKPGQGAQEQEIPPLRGYDFSDRKAPQYKLEKSLREISGLAFTQDGRLLGHSDELGVIYEIDYRTGGLKKQFSLGRPAIVQDFEGIAVKKDTVFLVASNGMLFRCKEGANGESMRYQTFRTGLDVRHNVEGLAYDPAADCLLLACKGYAGTGYEEQKAVYAFSLRTYKLQPRPRFLLPLKTISRQSDKKEFNPSGIERHPRSGNFFIIAFNGHSILEVSSNGQILGLSALPKSVHKQPEGIAIAANGTLVIANEGGGKEGSVVVYRPLK